MVNYVVVTNMLLTLFIARLLLQNNLLFIRRVRYLSNIIVPYSFFLSYEYVYQGTHAPSSLIIVVFVRSAGRL